MEIKNSMFAKLDPYRARLDPKAENATLRARDSRTESNAPSASDKDRVNLSATAKLYTLAHAEAGKAPDVRQEKVDSIRERIAAGDYDVDCRLVAEKLLRSEELVAGTLKE